MPYSNSQWFFVLNNDNVTLSQRWDKHAAYPDEPLSRIVRHEHGLSIHFRDIRQVENPQDASDASGTGSERNGAGEST